MKFIEAKDRRELRKYLDANNYEFWHIKKVDGGYMCFDNNAEYETWKNQR
jgi:DNA-dependent RNA polymerase auxiliary subunit epsilon